ncbi:membrane protein [Flavobacterium psychrophilum]|jgi:tellurite resistance protein TerC|uniref:Membrane protein TerC family, possibly involved in tellurium resistance n=5 Tax=Flavobacterium psychrophilum TaxID=96345 RepID=A6GX26_FLAPJ|nr:TerC family protein [Flavobacterium psychrophilum]AIG29452.1 membrane protein [Flavobacterium psychrophilum]AIG31729.1 membrane protein [Flavobacterium psychrophilum]AIG33883.1 membrane protein [Flavobacterium psychrophilum]AIG36245.1 membrane protein [Flavobacterium psychrophilum]AIG38511.1 membrane protein [Flavobacterium psychrophilum]
MIVWILFLAMVFVILALDLGIFNKTPHIISTKEASKWTAIWVTLSFAFSGVIYWLYGTDFVNNPNNLSQTAAALKFVTGYLIELSLSVDNIFIIAIIFASFKIPQKYQHRVLFWGILGAIFFRGIMISFGVILIKNFSWTNYVFGAFLLFTAIKMLFSKEDEENFEPKDSFVYKTLGKIIPITSESDKEKFFIPTKKGKAATPLFVALIVIEVMDVLFAVDSVPAILAITSDPFLVFSSNIFAILGLRSMYFFLANMLEKFSYLEYSLIAILSFVGLKMISHDYIEIPEWASLGFIAVSLLVGILVSLKMGSEQELND